MLENMSQIHDLRVLLLACLCLVVRVQGQTKAYGEGCTGSGEGDCTANANLKCDTTCKCADNYVRDADACKLKVGQTCSGTNATVCVSHTTCSGSKCTCLTGYNPGTGDHLGLCVETFIGMTCTDNTNCTDMGVSNAECTGTTTKTCNCMNGYYGDTCTKIIGEKVCTIDADCNAGTNALKHSRCSAGKCECLATAIEQNDICKLKVDQNCTANTDYCPNNAECTGTPTTKCTCKANYTPKDGICEVENAGMTVKISMMLMVAALISVFLQ